MLYGRERMRLLLLVLVLLRLASPQQPRVPQLDPFEQHTAGFALNDQSIVDGVSIVSQQTGLPVSVEYELGVSISSSTPAVRAISAGVRPGTVSEVLDQLCSLDQTFIWKRNGNMVNLVPRELAVDPNYFLNKRVDHLVFQDVPNAQEAVFKTAEQLPGAKEQIASFQSGMAIRFALPWSTKFESITVREVFNDIARHLGPTYGWQFGGARDFRVITFHERLSPKSSRAEQKPGAPGK